MKSNWRGDLPLYNSSTGRAFAAYLPPERLEELFNEEIAEQKRAEKLSTAEIMQRQREFARHLADTRKHGVARTTGERYPGLISFSAPIFDGNSSVVLVVTSFGLAATTFSAAWGGIVPAALKRTARKVTERIGGKEPH